MRKNKKAYDERIIPIAETLKTVRAILKPDALDYCALDPCNGYPICEPSVYFHIACPSIMSNKLVTNILATDENRLYGKATHMLAVISDAEYRRIHRKALGRKDTPLIPLFFFLEMNREEADFFSIEFMEKMLGESIKIPNGFEEVHFIRRSEWNEDKESVYSTVDAIMGRTGVYSHYIHLVDDVDADRILGAD